MGLEFESARILVLCPAALRLGQKRLLHFQCLIQSIQMHASKGTELFLQCHKENKQLFCAWLPFVQSIQMHASKFKQIQREKKQFFDCIA